MNASVTPADAPDPAMVVRTYTGGSQAAALRGMATEAELFRDHGYSPAGQSWEPEKGVSPAGGLILGAGIVLLLAGLLVWPAWILAVPCLVIGWTGRTVGGTLTVTWAKP